MRTYSDELEVIDVLDGESYTIVEIQIMCFHGDRGRCLKSLKHMFFDGVLNIRCDGFTVEPWRIETWARHPRFAHHDEAFAIAIVDLTDDWEQRMGGGGRR